MGQSLILQVCDTRSISITCYQNNTAWQYEYIALRAEHLRAVEAWHHCQFVTLESSIIKVYGLILHIVSLVKLKHYGTKLRSPQNCKQGSNDPLSCYFSEIEKHLKTILLQFAFMEQQTLHITSLQRTLKNTAGWSRKQIKTAMLSCWISIKHPK